MTILRALICEDSPDDAELLSRELRRGGYDLSWVRVDTADAMQAALEQTEWDIIFSDWHMPEFSALEALEVLHHKGLDLPFIIVSGTVGEETAVAALRRGAHDFFAKDRLVRLGTAVEREMGDRIVRQERALMREQLMIADRMASVGILAAGVGHEINNPLASVLGNLQLALDCLEPMRRALPDVEPADALEQLLRDAYESAERIRDVSNDLRLFARSDSDELSPVDVAAVVESSLRMARTEVRHRAQTVTDLSPVPMVAANESQLGQVLLNLIVNAAQAIPEGDVDANEIRIVTRRSDTGHVVIEVRDTGTGMSSEICNKLFTPFFTTKDPGSGTGLGLSICHRIITSFGGSIAVESEVGKGSTFRLTLPAAPDAATTAGGDAVQRRDPATRRGSILTIDDEPSLRLLVQLVLANDHDVIDVADATEALDLIAGGARFDVILCDLMMPRMTGMAFYEGLGRVAPEQAAAVVFLTGGAFTDQAREFLRNTTNDVIEKPFDIKALRTFVDGRVAGGR